jgi:hypothetical protein
MKTFCATGVLLLAITAAIPATQAASQKKAAKKESLKSLISRAQVWMQVDVSSMDLWNGPAGDGSFEPGQEIRCDYLDKKLSGLTPKFACKVPGSDDELKVKYGGGNGEVYAEVVATRLLWALGFGADRMYSVRVVCHGCPDKIEGGVSASNGDRIFDPAAVERKMSGKELSDQWSWDDLDKVDESKGGAPKAHRDALKLLASFIQHSDSKPVQQRLICVNGNEDENGRCATPLLMINDLGRTFGKSNLLNENMKGSVNFSEWSKLPVWKDATGCVANLSGSMSGTLKYPVIGEEGRQFLADLMSKLSDAQIHDMFAVGRVQLRPKVPGDGRSGFPTIDDWVNAFKQKRAELTDRHCGT